MKLLKLIKKYKLYWILVLPLIYVLYYLNTSSHPMQEATLALESTASVEVTNAANIVFRPVSTNGEGIIFYPGGKVDPESYAPLMKRLAADGYTCVIAKMPFNLAVFDIKAAQKIIQAETGVSTWYIGGHSLGGAMASQFVYKNPESVKGIFFLAAYPVDSGSLKDLPIRSLSFYGENDGLVSVAEMSQHQLNLPKDQTLLIIPGGNHAQFGYYGPQKNDGEATISRDEQQNYVYDHLMAWLTEKAK